MQSNVTPNPFMYENNDAEESNLFFQRLTEKLLVLWPWMIASAAIFLSLAYFYLKYSSPQYKIHASVLVQDDQKGGGMGEAGSLLKDFGLIGGRSNVDNEAEIFKSRSLMEQVVEDLQLNVRYYLPGRVKSREIYEDAPVNLYFINYSVDSFYKPSQYTIDFSKKSISSFRISNGHMKVDAHIGDTLDLQEGRAVVKPARGFAWWDAAQQLIVSINSVDATVQRYSPALNVNIPNKQVSVIYLTLTEKIPSKGERIVNALLNAYLKANVNDKNRIADSTMHFIDERLRLVSGELTGIEKDIEGFKTTNKLTDLTTQSRILLENSSEYNKQQTSQEVQLSVINALEKFLADNKDNARVVPSSLVMQDLSFIAIVGRYNEMMLQKDRMLMSLTPEHPRILSINEQLQNMRQELLSSISSVKRGIEVSINEIKKHTNSFEGQMTKVPATERKFLDFSRQQSIKQELYLFLLTKREETAISKSSTIANARVVDAAKSEMSPFKPSKTMIMIMGFMVGLIIPFGFSMIRDLFNNKISSVEDISKITQTPILAEIGHNKEGQVVAVTTNSRQLISEQLRSLRTNLQYLLTGENDKVILLTSSMSGEGKSFLSINFAAVLALAGKKVILLELDLRKPKLTENLKLSSSGFTDFIISNNNDWKKWVQPTGVHEGFHFMSSGPLPPNPSELLMLPKVAQLFQELKDNYDYIIVDSPPVGMVTDAEILAYHAQITLYVVRHSYTFKQQIRLIEKFYNKNALPKMNIVVNDVASTKKAYGYYGYGTY